MAANASSTETDYPLLEVPHIQNPNRLWALPVIGGTVKLLVMLPVAFWLMVIAYVALLLSIINSFAVLFTGRYLDIAYVLAVGAMRLSAKANFFFLGLTDAYPGFGLASSDDVRLDIDMPARPSRFFALPLLGGFVRLVLLIPFLLLLSVVAIPLVLIFYVAWIPVLFLGQFPEFLYRYLVYVQRLQLRMSAYTFGLADRYPRFD